ncbi:MAG: hypothetical protein WKF77_18670 [Planctomycetaceae bacterium]
MAPERMDWKNALPESSRIPEIWSTGVSQDRIPKAWSVCENSGLTSRKLPACDVRADGKQETYLIWQAIHDLYVSGS